MQLHAVRAENISAFRDGLAQRTPPERRCKSCPARPATFQVAIQGLSLAALTLDQTGAVESTMMAWLRFSAPQRWWNEFAFLIIYVKKLSLFFNDSMKRAIWNMDPCKGLLKDSRKIYAVDLIQIVCGSTVLVNATRAVVCSNVRSAEITIEYACSKN